MKEQQPKFQGRAEENLPQPRFDLGATVATPGALEALAVAEREPAELLTRHVLGDWGDMDEEDKQLNEESVVTGGRIFSAYILPETDVKLWVITEWDRSATTILLPEDY